MAKVNSNGRAYITGKPLGEDFRSLIIDEMISNGAPVGVVHYKGMYAMAEKVGKKFKICTKSVLKYWKQHNVDGNLKASKPGKKVGTFTKLSDDHIAFVENLLRQKPSVTAGYVHTQYS